MKVTKLIMMWIKNIIDIVIGIIAFMLCYGVLNQLIWRFYQSDILTYVIIIALCIYSIETSIVHIVKRVNTYRKNVNNNKPYLSYAVDFDGTLCDSEYPNFGKPNKRLIKFLIKKKKEGHKVTLWTCREGTELLNAVKWCEKHGLTFDAVNENLPEDIEVFGSDPRKIGYDILIDDKNDIYKSIWLPFKGDIFD